MVYGEASVEGGLRGQDTEVFPADTGNVEASLGRRQEHLQIPGVGTLKKFLFFFLSEIPETC